MNKYNSLNNYQMPSFIERNSQVEASYGAMYIDNFTGSDMNSRLQINDYIGNPGQNHPQYEVFQDDLNSNGSNMSISRGSAFDRS